MKENWKDEYITKRQAVNAIIRNHEKLRNMPVVNGAEVIIKNLKSKEQSE